MQQGSIVRMIRDRGFGFIRTERGDEIFFHATGCRDGNFDAMEEGQQVTFDIEEDRRGRGQRAVNVAIAA